MSRLNYATSDKIIGRNEGHVNQDCSATVLRSEEVSVSRKNVIVAAAKYYSEYYCIKMFVGKNN
jgi:hypothetical protein